VPSRAPPVVVTTMLAPSRGEQEGLGASIPPPDPVMTATLPSISPMPTSCSTALAHGEPGRSCSVLSTSTAFSIPVTGASALVGRSTAFPSGCRMTTRVGANMLLRSALVLGAIVLLWRSLWAGAGARAGTRGAGPVAGGQKASRARRGRREPSG